MAKKMLGMSSDVSKWVIIIVLVIIAIAVVSMFWKRKQQENFGHYKRANYNPKCPPGKSFSVMTGMCL